MTYLEKLKEKYPGITNAEISGIIANDCPSDYFDEFDDECSCPEETWNEDENFYDCEKCWNLTIPCSCNCSNCTCTTETTENNNLKGDKNMRNSNVTPEMRREMATENNQLGLQVYDLVKTVGKGIGIVLHKPSDDELVIYSASSACVTHPNDDDGMAKVRRYNADGTIATHSETTGKKLANREIYTITGIKSYANPILAMKDVVNQNEDVEFDPIYVEPEVEEVAEEPVAEASANTPVTEGGVMEQMLALLMKINDKLDRI